MCSLCVLSSLSCSGNNDHQSSNNYIYIWPFGRLSLDRLHLVSQPISACHLSPPLGWTSFHNSFYIKTICLDVKNGVPWGCHAKNWWFNIKSFVWEKLWATRHASLHAIIQPRCTFLFNTHLHEIGKQLIRSSTIIHFCWQRESFKFFFLNGFPFHIGLPHW